MQIDIISIFPEFFRGPLDYGIVRRAREAGLVKIDIHDLRAFTRDRHRTVDDRPFGAPSLERPLDGSAEQRFLADTRQQA